MTRILSLDDDPELLQRFAVALNLAGYEHLLATQSKEALSILHNERIDLFTQDLARPDMPGWDLYELMKADDDLRSIPVLFLSGFGGWYGSHIERLTEFGDDYLTKPFRLEEFLTVVTAMIKRRHKRIPSEEDRITAYERLKRDSNWEDKDLDDLYRRISNILNELKASA
jgi:DNA-binding response OmpR family regulator